MAETPPLVLVHGLWDSPRVFNPLIRHLDGRREPILVPYLPHGIGQVRLEKLAEQLATYLASHLEAEQPIDLLGFSMGGVIARIWLQWLGGHRRTRRFISLGSPQQGTFNALACPPWLLPGIADMGRGSSLLRRLNQDTTGLQHVECISLYTPLDLIVTPGWQAALPRGRREGLLVWTHDRLLRSPIALERLTRELLKP